ncbi:MAG: tail fiber domain-containing protein [Pseudobdellovibrio sp.]|nr:tail fiber domain-containing protein [Pseudobdellovibrio sp.]
MKKRRLLDHFVISIFVFMMLNTLSVFAGPSRTTYQAKIIKPDGYPLESTNVNFKFTILDPLGSCILYSETFSNVNMGSSAGLVSFALGTGVRTFPVVGSNFEQVFSNMAASLICDSGGPATYSPSANDTRKIVMQFNDSTGWQTLPAMTINAVPYAMYANDSLKFSGKDITDFVQTASLPTCGASEAIRFNGAGFSCIAAGGTGTITSGSVTTALGYTPADGASVTAMASTVNSVSSTVASVSSTVYSVSSTVTSLQNSVAASFAAITSSQWSTIGADIYYGSRVGVGTSSPSTLFDVGGWSEAPAGLANGANITGNLYVGNTGSNIARTRLSSNVNGGFLQWNRLLTASGAVQTDVTKPSFNFEMNGTTDRFIFQRSAASSTTLVDLMSITGSGRVGIGVSSPVTALDVSGAIRIGVDSSSCTTGLAGTLRYNAGVVEYCNGTSWAAFGISGAGILAINGLASGSQTFAFGSTGTTPNVSSVGSVHTFNFPYASAATTTAGVISYSDYLNFSNKQVGTSAAIIATLGYTPADSVSLTSLSSTVGSVSAAVNSVSSTVANLVSTVASVSSSVNSVSSSVASLQNSVAASLSAITSSQWTTSGTNIFYNTGNVGIGASSPVEMLHLHAATGVLRSGFRTSWTDTNAYGEWNAYEGATFMGGISVFGSTYPTSAYRNAFMMSAANNNLGSLIFRTRTGGVYQERMNILNNGYVGIGTSSPTQRLEVDGGISSMSNADNSTSRSVRISMMTDTTNTVNGFGNGDPWLSLDGGANSGSATLQIVGNQNRVLNVRLHDGSLLVPYGNIGVGLAASAPASRLHVADNSAVILTLERQNNQNSLIEHKNTLGSVYTGQITSTTDWGVGTGIDLGTSALFRVTSSGRAYIGGTTAPTARLHITAGTSSVAPVKLTTGTLLTTPQAGAIEYDGTDYYITDSSNVRRTIATASTGGVLNNTSVVSSTSGITLWPAAGNSVVVSSTVASTNSTTGALIVNGGAGIAGALNVGGIISGSATIKGTGFRANQGAPDAADSSTVGYAFGSDGDTGIFSPGTGSANGVLSFYSNNAEKMHLDTAGNLGIGTSSPTQKLHVSEGDILVERSTTSPSLKLNNTFTGGRQYALYSHASGSGGLSRFIIKDITSGTERFIITDQGNVGIGTAAPSGKLSVVSGAQIMNFGTGTNTSGYTFNFGLNDDGINFDNSSTVRGYNFKNGNGTLMTMTAAGNVGIGTSSPSVLLTVDDTNGSVAAPYIASTDKLAVIGTGNTVIQVTTPSSNTAAIYFSDPQSRDPGGVAYSHLTDSMSFRANGATRMTIASGGAVGIATGSPSYALDVNGQGRFQTAMAQVFQVVGAGTGYSDAVNGVATIYSQNTAGSGGNVLKVGSAFAPNGFVVKDTGSVGIGVTSPLTALEVNGGISTKGGEIIMQRPTVGGGWARGLHYTPDGSANATANGLAGIGLLGSGATQTSIYLAFGTAPWASSTGMHILSNGNVGVGLTNPTALFHVNGAALATAWNTSSDKRLKENIKPIDDSVNKILQLRGVEFDWRKDVKAPTKHDEIHDIGVIAQEVEKVFPEAVTTPKTGYKSVAYSKLVAPLIEAVKSLYHRILGIEAQQAEQARTLASKADQQALNMANAKIQKLESENAAKEKELQEMKLRLEKIEKALNSK